MVEFWMQKIASYDGQEYVLVDEDTMARLNALVLAVEKFTLIALLGTTSKE